ncbi:MAG: hypothetical protein CMJ96_08020, partial [Planctomycetes bacterium]|nr:hypothetical protein [Planctomycetota bacterium]
MRLPLLWSAPSCHSSALRLLLGLVLPEGKKRLIFSPQILFFLSLIGRKELFLPLPLTVRHFFLPLIFLLLPSVGLAQTTWYVPDDFSTIQAGIDGSANGDTVIVRDGTYVENINFNGKAITLKSENGPVTTIIDGNQAGTVVTFSNGEDKWSVLDGFTLENGVGADADNGGGVTCWLSSPTISNNTISGNSASYDGGGIYCYDSDPTISNNTISGNSASRDGGGMYCYSSDPTISDNVIETNTADFG